MHRPTANWLVSAPKLLPDAGHGVAPSWGSLRAVTERLFGTDGVRGLGGHRADRGPRVPPRTRRRGRAGPPRRGRIRRSWSAAIPRASGEWLEDALVEGIREAGGDAFIAGVEPTPAIAFLTTDLEASSGRRHLRVAQPARVQRHQVLRRDRARSSPTTLEDEIEAALDDAGDRAGAARAQHAPDGRRARAVPRAPRSRPPRRGSTACASWSTARTVPRRSSRPSCCAGWAPTVHAIHAEPDGKNINDGCGALLPGGRGARRSCGSAPTPASRTTATPTGRCSPTPTARSSTATRCSRRARSRCTTRGALAGEHGRHDRDGEPRLPPRDAGGGHRGRRVEGRRPLRARGHGADAARCSAASSPAT